MVDECFYWKIGDVVHKLFVYWRVRWGEGDGRIGVNFPGGG